MPSPRVILFEPVPGGEPPLRDLLAGTGCEVLEATTADALVDAVGSGRHQVVLFAVSPDRPDDLVTLRLLRRLAPDFPLVVVATDSSLEVRRLIQTARPVYFAARPVDPDELCEALRDACLPRRTARDEIQPDPGTGRTRGHSKHLPA